LAYFGDTEMLRQSRFYFSRICSLAVHTDYYLRNILHRYHAG